MIRGGDCIHQAAMRISRENYREKRGQRNEEWLFFGGEGVLVRYFMKMSAVLCSR